MQAADILILIILAIPSLVGVAYGFLNIVFSLLAWLAAAGLAIKCYPFFSPLLEPYIDNELFRSVLAYIVVFIISLVVLSILGYFIVKLLGRAGLTAADRVFGLLFGFSLGIGIVSVIVFLAGFTAFPKENWWQSSILLSPFEKVALWTQQYLPENVVKHHGYAVPDVSKPPIIAPEDNS